MSSRYMVPLMTQRQTPVPPESRVPAAEAAKMLGVSVRTLDRYQAAGKIAPCPVPIAPRLFRVADIEALTKPRQKVSA